MVDFLSYCGYLRFPHLWREVFSCWLPEFALGRVVTQTDAVQGESAAKLSRENWVDAALLLFAKKGIDAVRIEPLAQDLNVTKGSFYWHFKNRTELHQAIIDYWSERSTRVLSESVAKSSDIIDVVLNVFCVWMRDEPFSPQLDAAMRDWSRRSDAVRAAVMQADVDRTRIIAQAFLQAGYSEKSAHIRSRALYFVQIGYYETYLSETRGTRIEHWREYVKVITGLELSYERLAEFRDRNFTAAELAAPTF